MIVLLNLQMLAMMSVY